MKHPPFPGVTASPLDEDITLHLSNDNDGHGELEDAAKVTFSESTTKMLFAQAGLQVTWPLLPVDEVDSGSDDHEGTVEQSLRHIKSSELESGKADGDEEDDEDEDGVGLELEHSPPGLRRGEALAAWRPQAPDLILGFDDDDDDEEHDDERSEEQQFPSTASIYTTLATKCLHPLESYLSERLEAFDPRLESEDDGDGDCASRQLPFAGFPSLPVEQSTPRRLPQPRNHCLEDDESLVYGFANREWTLEEKITIAVLEAMDYRDRNARTVNPGGRYSGGSRWFTTRSQGAIRRVWKELKQRVSGLPWS